jgi:hypothetical protein
MGGWGIALSSFLNSSEADGWMTQSLSEQTHFRASAIPLRTVSQGGTVRQVLTVMANRYPSFCQA